MENNSFELTRMFQRLYARTQPSFDQTDDGVDAETSLSLSLTLHLMFISLKPIIRFLEIPNNKPYTGLGCSNNRGIPWLCSTSKPRLHALRQATLQRRGGIRATGRGKGCAKLHQNT